MGLTDDEKEQDLTYLIKQVFKNVERSKKMIYLANTLPDKGMEYGRCYLEIITHMVEARRHILELSKYNTESIDPRIMIAYTQFAEAYAEFIRHIDILGKTVYSLKRIMQLQKNDTRRV